jgi:transcription elongation factor
VRTPVVPSRTPVPSTIAPVRTPVLPSTNTKSARTPVLSSSTAVSPSTVSKPATPSFKNVMPKWNPPGRSYGEGIDSPGSDGRSPSTGLRIGLSRKMKVKPLHSSVKLSGC